MPAIRNSKPPRRSNFDIAAVLAALMALSAAAVWFFYRNGWLLYYGDAEAHLNLARGVFDSRTPAPDQIGSVWLPLPHLLMLPFLSHDWLWRSGLGGSFYSAVAYVAAGGFLFAAAKRTLGRAAALTAVALFALNPNLLYIQSIPMTESLMAACVLGVLYFSVLFAQTQSLWAAAAAGALACAGTLTRYDGWFLLPFAALYLLWAAKRNRLRALTVFCVIAGIGPVSWLAHNWFWNGDALFFFRGPYSAKAIQGGSYYPGKDDWYLSALYYGTAVRLCAGWPLLLVGLLGVGAGVLKRALWPVVFLLLLPLFYVWSMHSSGGTPIFVPTMWPHAYYNTRYGLAMLPLLAFGAAAVVAMLPPAWRTRAALVVVLASLAPWLLQPKPEAWITWKESKINSDARRDWTGQAARYMQRHYRQGEGIYMCFGDLTGILRAAGIPQRAALTGNNRPLFEAARQRPELFLWESWAVAMGGDAVQSAILHSKRHGPSYELVYQITVKGAPAIEIYRRALVNERGEDPLHESARSEERLPAVLEQRIPEQ